MMTTQARESRVWRSYYSEEPSTSEDELHKREISRKVLTSVKELWKTISRQDPDLIKRIFFQNNFHFKMFLYQLWKD